MKERKGFCNWCGNVYLTNRKGKFFCKPHCGVLYTKWSMASCHCRNARKGWTRENNVIIVDNKKVYKTEDVLLT